MEVYKINFRTQWANASGILWIAIVFIIGIQVTPTLKESISTSLACQIFGIAFLVQFLPQLALHLNYYFVNKGDVLTYDKIFKEMSFLHNGRQINFTLDDIEQIILYKSFALHKGNIQLWMWDTYNHAVIVLKDSTKIIITSLMVGAEIRIPVDSDKIKVKLNFYRWVKGGSLGQRSHPAR